MPSFISVKFLFMQLVTHPLIVHDDVVRCLGLNVVCMVGKPPGEVSLDVAADKRAAISRVEVSQASGGLTSNHI